MLVYTLLFAALVRPHWLGPATLASHVEAATVVVFAALPVAVRPVAEQVRVGKTHVYAVVVVPHFALLRVTGRNSQVFLVVLVA